MNMPAIDDYEYGDPEPAFMMEVELLGGDSTVIGFCERHQPDNVGTLQQLVANRPNISPLITPLLEVDPQWADGEIKFTRLDEDVVDARLFATTDEGAKPTQVYQKQITVDQYKQLVRLVESMAVLMIDNGETALNI